jgi:hypothetical protein
VLLRCTKKLLVVLGPGFVVESAAVPDPQDWYANLVSFGGRKCLLLTQAATLFTIVAPDVRAPDLRSLDAFVVGLIERELAAENLVLAKILIRAGGKCRVACGILGVSTESVLPPGPSLAAAA